ncbi:hypothetical protein HAX54_045522, partial [Datura stramonium]|nr:hypothetical protein [Datura stramonium]
WKTVRVDVEASPISILFLLLQRNNLSPYRFLIIVQGNGKITNVTGLYGLEENDSTGSSS